jgi:hypothetical protein
VKPYDANGLCPKCGAGGATVSTRFFYGVPRSPEHIRRECGRCRFDWREAPLDAARTNADRSQVAALGHTDRMVAAAHAGVTRFPSEVTPPYPPGPGGLNPRD